MWISFTEALDVLSISKRSLYFKIEKGEYDKKTEGTEIFLRLESLPACAQLTYAQTHEISNSEYEFSLDNIRQLSPEDTQTAIQRMQLVLDMDHVPAGSKKGEYIDSLCRGAGIPKSTLYRWRDTLQSQGFAALVKRQERSDKGASRTMDRAAAEFLKAQYLDTKNKRLAYGKLEREAVERGWNLCSYAQATRILRQEVDCIRALNIYMRGGDVALKNEATPCILRDFSDLMPLEYVCGDHHQFDVLVWDEEEKKIIRPWLSAFQDMRSRAFWGWNINRQPNSRTIALALRHGILPKSDDNPIHGIPKNVYVDNGKDYKSYYLSGNDWKFRRLGVILPDVETDGVFARLGISKRFALPFNPGAKPIERYFATIEQTFCSTLPGYIAGRPDRRDGAKVQSDIDHLRLITYRDFKAALEKYIVYDLHQKESRARDMKGLSPAALWQQYLDEGFQPSSFRPMTLDVLLLHPKIGVKVERHGVRVEGEWYRNPSLIHYLKDRVDVRFDPDDMSQIYIFRENKYLLTATKLQYGSMHDNPETISARMRENRGAAKEIKEKYLILSGGVDRPSNRKGNSFSIKKTKYDEAALALEADPLPELRAPRNWNILPTDEEN